MQNKRGQTTIFIIIALIIVAAVIFFVIFREKTQNIKSPSSFESPLQYIETCSIDATKEAIDIMLPQGGYLNPKLYRQYGGNKVAFLCYNSGFYDTCINQNPMFVQHLEREIKSYIEPIINDCFSTLRQDYEKKGISVDMGGESNINVDVVDGKVLINVIRDFSFVDKGESKNYREFKANFNSPLYNLGRMAMEIVNQESKFCHSEYLGIMIYYNWVKMTKTDINGEVKIYEITDKQTGKKLNIAIRSCAFPKGF